jgi:hypothetical protein
MSWCTLCNEWRDLISTEMVAPKYGLIVSHCRRCGYEIREVVSIKAKRLCKNRRYNSRKQSEVTD